MGSGQTQGSPRPTPAGSTPPEARQPEFRHEAKGKAEEGQPACMRNPKGVLCADERARPVQRTRADIRAIPRFRPAHHCRSKGGGGSKGAGMAGPAEGYRAEETRNSALISTRELWRIRSRTRAPIGVGTKPEPLHAKHFPNPSSSSPSRQPPLPLQVAHFSSSKRDSSEFSKLIGERRAKYQWLESTGSHY